MKDCPCGLNAPYVDCCGPLIRGTGVADSAEDLMRSRFTAHVLEDWDYLLRTTAAEDRENKEAADFAEAQAGIRWQRLEILGTRAGGLHDDVGEVEYAAYYREGEEEGVMRETSRFIREKNRWVYSQRGSKVHKPKEATAAPAAPKTPFVREGAKVGRNDPCTCGSGKKYKKCCGR